MNNPPGESIAKEAGTPTVGITTPQITGIALSRLSFLVLLIKNRLNNTTYLTGPE